MKLIVSSLALFAACSLSSNALAESAGKEITVEGKGCCAKCCLKIATECQDAITVEKNGKKTTYLLPDNDIAKAFHKEICKAVKPVKATGTCKKAGDHFELTVSKIELAK